MRLLAVVLIMAVVSSPACAVTLVRDSQAAASICISTDASETVRQAADDLARYIERMSGARLDIVTDPVRGRSAVLLGEPAVKAGLKLTGPTLWKEAYSIRATDGKLLIAGESDIATRYAVYHFLETLGCRWFMDGELGEVIPSLKTIDVPKLDIREKPDFAVRRFWGSQWFTYDQWKVANRTGGLKMDMGHAWSGLLPEGEHFQAHPEYYSLLDGVRKPRQLCTSNPDVVRLVTESVLRRFRSDPARISVSLSPNDGGGFCQCDNCRKLDVEGYLEPSSGSVCLSDRFQVFYNAVARGVAQEFPDRLLNFYAYADYTLPPKRERKIEPNLAVWIAPIRHCRMHGIGSPICETRAQLGRLIDGWGQIAPRIGYRTYNFNLAECIAPYSKLSIWKQEIPFLKAHKCLGIDFETLGAWAIEGPHIYLSARLAWDAEADPDEIMNDYYDKLCGKAAPHIKSYWERIDRAFTEVTAHDGGFNSIPTIYTPELLRACARDLDAAEKAAAGDTDVAKNSVRVFRRGFENAWLFMEMHDAINSLNFPRAKKTYDQLAAHVDSMVADKILNRHGAAYLRRFIEPAVLDGNARSTGGNRILARLPDEWSFTYDPDDKGEVERFWAPETSTTGWARARTYSAMLDQQEVGERPQVMWYRASVSVPADASGKKLFLWFAEIDGRAKVWVNGVLAGEDTGARKPFDVAVSELVKPGEENLIVVQVDHRRITELFLGGIIAPGMIYSSEDGTPPVADPPTQN